MSSGFPPFLKNARMAVGRTAGAFSLVELLAVVAVIALIAAFLVPATANMVGAQRLTAAGSDLAARFALARQTAIAAALPVELRLYEMPSESGTDTFFSASRLVKITNQTGTDGELLEEPVGRVAKFPAGVAAVADTPYSTLLSDSVQTAGSPSEALPGAAGTVPYRRIRFLPNGQADLPVGGTADNEPWTLTLADLRQGDKFSAGGTAANYVVLVLDPLTGSVRSFRP